MKKIKFKLISSDNKNKDYGYTLMKRHKKYYITFSIFLALFLIIAFQNCGKIGNTLHPRIGVVGSPSDPLPSPTPYRGDHAIFELQGVNADQMESVLWHTNYPSKRTNTGIAVRWRQRRFLLPNLKVFVKLKGQNCISYINNSYNINNSYKIYSLREGSVSSSSQAGDSQSALFIKSTDDLSTSIASLDSKDHLSKPFKMQRPHISIDIEASTADEPYTFKDYFPVGTTVNFSASSRSSYRWSIQRLFQHDEEQVTVNANTEQNFSHIFPTMGFYSVKVSAGPHSSGEREILVGACTGAEEEAIEIILSDTSFGDRTPPDILQNPYFNYIRPATPARRPATPGHKITVLKEITGGAVVRASDTGIQTTYKSFRDYNSIYYKYDRASSSKFIDVNIQNVKSEMRCFFDDQPVVDCSDVWCDPDCDDSCPYYYTTYHFRDNLTPLDSCNGNVYDMSALDTDITECTDAIVLFGFAIDAEDEPYPMPFYKHCPANSQYCYFGPERSRPDHHHCPLEDPPTTPPLSSTTTSTSTSSSTTSSSTSST